MTPICTDTMSSLPMPPFKQQRVQTPSREPHQRTQVAVPVEIIHSAARQQPSNRQEVAKTVARRLDFDDL